MNSHNPNAEIIHKAAAILKAAKEKIKTTFNSVPELTYLADVTFSQLGEIEKRMYGLAGLPQSSTTVVETNFGPLEKIMGITVSRKPLSIEDLTPTPTEKEKLKDRIIAFHSRIPELSNEKVLEVLYEPKGEAILRGSAKMAGLTNWKDADLTVFFVQDVKEAIDANKAVDDAVKKAEAASQLLKEKALLPEDYDLGKLEGIGNPEDEDPGEDPDQTGDTGGDEEKEGPDHEDDNSDGEGDSNAEGDKDEKEEEDVNPANQAKALKAEGKTHKEISEALNIPVGSVSGLLKK